MAGSSLPVPLSKRARFLSQKATLNRVFVSLFALFFTNFLAAGEASAQGIPATQAVALDGHPVSLPRDLPGRATILILGFGRHSKDATTAWEIPVRTRLAQTPAIGFYDMAMISEVPGFMRGMVLRAIKHDVPDVLKPNFLPLTDGEDAWKQAAGYAKDQPEAAYVLLVDHDGRVVWTTHAAYSDSGFAELGQRARRLAGLGG
jgi:hypothetical protein